MSQQESSYFDPEQEAVYEPHVIDRDSGEFQEEAYEEQEQTISYMTPEQSMLKGEKLIPMSQIRSYQNWRSASETNYRNWLLTALFLLMILIGGLLWTIPSHPTPSSYCPDGYGHYYQCDQPSNLPSDQDGDGSNWP